MIAIIFIGGRSLIEQFLEKHIQHNSLKLLLEWFITVFITAILCFALQEHIFRIASIDGVSMEPTLHNNDKVIVTNLGYMFSAPDYNDVIAFAYRNNENQFLAKRIIGVPGDEIDFIDGVFYRNGELLEGEYSEETVNILPQMTMPIIVPSEKYFVLGDNRNNSVDSRMSDVGFVSVNDIIGKIFFIFWPSDRIGSVQ